MGVRRTGSTILYLREKNPSNPPPPPHTHTHTHMQDYERRITDMEDAREKALQELTEYYEAKLQDKSMQLEQVSLACGKRMFPPPPPSSASPPHPLPPLPLSTHLTTSLLPHSLPPSPPPPPHSPTNSKRLKTRNVSRCVKERSYNTRQKRMQTGRF